MSMKLSAAAAGVILLAGAVGAIAEDVILVPEQETTIRQYVVKHPVEPLVLTPEVDVSVGSTLPDTVELYPIEEPNVAYRYVVVDGRTVLVDPGTRKIVRIMK